MARTRKPALPNSVSRKALLIGGSDTTFRQVVDDLLLLATDLQSARFALAALVGVTPPQYKMMMYLARQDAPEGLALSALAQALDVSLSFVVAETRRLQKKNLFTLSRDKQDARVVRASLAANGWHALKQAFPAVRCTNDRYFGALTRHELIELGRLAALVNKARAGLPNQAKKATPKKGTPKKATPKIATPKKATPKKATPKKAAP